MWIKSERDIETAFGKRPESCEVVKSAGDNEWSRRYTLKRGGQELPREYTPKELVVPEDGDQTDTKAEETKDVEGAM